MKVFYPLCFFLVFPFFTWSQVSMNMNLLGFYDPAPPPGQSNQTYNDCWGYHDPSTGKEYAILGGWNPGKVIFVDVTNPANPTLVTEFSNGSVPGLNMSNPAWRDFKTYNGYCYAVSDFGAEGMLIFDMNTLPGSVTFVTQTSAFFTRAHNIFIDTNSGRLYVAGSDTQAQGLIVLDLTADPENPTLLSSKNLTGQGGGGYVHDLYVRNDTAYCSHGTSGYYIWDYRFPTDVHCPQAIGSYQISGYNHSSWLTNNGDYAFVAEEVPTGLPLAVLDISDMLNISLETTFNDPLNAPLNNTPHNPFVLDSLLIVSYYEDGVQIFDISNPVAPQLVGYYDTYPDNGSTYTGYEGCWGVYPYLPSGNIIASDIDYGLRMLEYDPAILPVELIAFNAEKISNDRIEIIWTTATEKALSHFEVERSGDDLNFKTIANLSPSGGNEPARYDLIDPAPRPGLNYYRLKSIDYDGSFTYSKVVQVEITAIEARVWPTVLNNTSFFNTYLPEGGKLSVFNTAGQLILEQEINEFDLINVEGWNAGLYYLLLERNGQQEVLEIIR